MKKLLLLLLIVFFFLFNLLLCLEINKPKKNEIVLLSSEYSYVYQIKENQILQKMGLAIENIDHSDVYATLITLDENKNYFTIVDIISKTKNLEIASAMKNKYRGNYSIICDAEYLKNKSYIPNICIDPNLTVNKKNLSSLYGVLLENNYAIIMACYYKSCDEGDFVKFYKQIYGN